MVFDKTSFQDTRHVRAAIFTVQYLSKDKKAVLLASPKLQAIKIQISHKEVFDKRKKTQNKRQLYIVSHQKTDISCEPPKSYIKVCLDYYDY